MVDSHCHLADEAFVGDLEGVVERAQSAGVGAALSMIDPTSEAEGRRAARAAELWPALHFAVGVHPHQAGAFAQDPAAVEGVVREAAAAAPRLAAVGEIGLDYHYDIAPRALQRELFARQVRLARTLGRPVVIHTREADDDTIDVLRAEGGGLVAGVLHCFTGDAAFARRGLDLGLYVSFSGIITFRNADTVRDAATIVPADRLLAETDAPYLAPAPFRGKRNEPAWVARVVETLAAVRGTSPGRIADETAAAFGALVGADP
jgi:TatD DNase family protein